MGILILEILSSLSLIFNQILDYRKKLKLIDYRLKLLIEQNSESKEKIQQKFHIEYEML
jgi:hypothetical protein